MINFHGANTPSGESTSWPNEMTREGVMGLEYFPRSIQHYCALPFTRYVAGPGDFTPFYPSNNQGRLAGTSWTMQLACAIIYTSPIQNFAFGPKEIAEAAPKRSLQRAILKDIPVTWDETIVLTGAEIGKLAPFARRKGDVWYVGIINGETHRKGSLKLGFLAAGKRYRAELISDDAEKNNNWQVSETAVSSYDTLSVIMRAKGGFVARFIPIEER
jgi:alpha-glucosidase